MISWVLAAWVITAFAVGGVVSEEYALDDIAWNIGYALIYSCTMVGTQMGAYYGLFANGACQYYYGEGAEVCDL